MSRFSPSQILPKRLHALYKRDIDHVRSSAAFGAAVRLFTGRNRSIIANNFEPAFGKYIGDVANVLIESAALHFHLLKTHRNLGFGATLSQLQLVGFVHGYASPRRVSMYVKRMVQVGRLTYGSDSKDKRVRRLVPGEPIIATATKHVGDLLAASDLVWPGSAFEQRVLKDREFFYRMYLEMGSNYLGGADPLRPFSDIRYFTSKDSGALVLNYLIHDCLDDKDRRKSAPGLSINYTDLARHCGATRTHVRNIIEGAAERGLLTVNGERSVRLNEKLIESFERYFACLLILMHRSAMDAAKPGPR